MISEDSQGVTGAIWSASPGFLFTGGEDYCVRVWNVAAGEPLVGVSKGHGGPIAVLQAASDSSFVLSAGDDHKIVMHSLPLEGSARFPVARLPSHIVYA